LGGLIGVMRGVITSTRSSTPASSNGAGVGNLGYARKSQWCGCPTFCHHCR